METKEKTLVLGAGLAAALLGGELSPGQEAKAGVTIDAQNDYSEAYIYAYHRYSSWTGGSGTVSVNDYQNQTNTTAGLDSTFSHRVDERTDYVRAVAANEAGVYDYTTDGTNLSGDFSSTINLYNKWSTRSNTQYMNAYATNRNDVTFTVDENYQLSYDWDVSDTGSTSINRYAQLYRYHPTTGESILVRNDTQSALGDFIGGDSTTLGPGQYQLRLYHQARLRKSGSDLSDANQSAVVGYSSGFDLTPTTETVALRPNVSRAIDRLVAPSPLGGDYLGLSGENSMGLDADGSVMVAGAYRRDADDGNGGILYDTGAVEVFRKNGAWGHSQTLINPTPQAYDQFGWGVRAADNHLAVSARLHNADPGNSINSSGQIYLYEADVNGIFGSPVAIQSMGGASNGQAFGTYFDFDGRTLAVGSVRNDITDDPHSVELFERNQTTGQWDVTTRLSNPAGAAGDGFGRALDVNGDHLLVGANYADTGGIIDSGAAYLFTRDNTGAWVDSAITLVAPELQQNSWFGSAVAIEGRFAAVGAHRFDDEPYEIDTGTVFLYEDDGSGNWSYAQTLAPESLEYGDSFGYALDMVDGRLAVGAYSDNTDGSNSGAVYLYELDEYGDWLFTDKVTAGDEQYGIYFGQSLALTEDELFGHSRIINDDSLPNGSGAIYTYAVPEPSSLALLTFGGLVMLRRRRNLTR